MADSIPFGCGANAFAVRPFEHIYHFSSDSCYRVADIIRQSEKTSTPPDIRDVFTDVLVVDKFALLNAELASVVTIPSRRDFLCRVFSPSVLCVANIGALLCTYTRSTHIVILKLCYVVGIL